MGALIIGQRGSYKQGKGAHVKIKGALIGVKNG